MQNSTDGFIDDKTPSGESHAWKTPVRKDVRRSTPTGGRRTKLGEPDYGMIARA